MPASPVTVLIIEDEPDVRIYLLNLLRANGYGARAAANIDEGLTLVRRVNPSLVVLDAMLPGDDAQRIYTELRCEAGLCRIPVVLLSTLTRRVLWGSRLYSTGSGNKRLPEPDAYLTKPPEAEDFLAVVQRLTTECKPTEEI